jgi:hypothetical protein
MDIFVQRNIFCTASHFMLGMLLCKKKIWQKSFYVLCFIFGTTALFPSNSAILNLLAAMLDLEPNHQWYEYIFINMYT